MKRFASLIVCLGAASDAPRMPNFRGVVKIGVMNDMSARMPTRPALDRWWAKMAAEDYAKATGPS